MSMTLSLLVYGSIMLGCLSFFAVSLIFGGDFETDHGGDFHGEADAHADGHSDIPRFLSVRNFFLFGVGFVFCGLFFGLGVFLEDGVYFVGV